MKTLKKLWWLVSGALGFVADVSAVSQLFNPSAKTIVFPFIDFQFRPLTGWVITFLIVSYVLLAVCLLVFMFCKPDDDEYWFDRDKRRAIWIFILLALPVNLFHLYILSWILGFDVPQMIEAESHVGLYYFGAGIVTSYIASRLIAKLAKIVYGID